MTDPNRPTDEEKAAWGVELHALLFAAHQEALALLADAGPAQRAGVLALNMAQRERIESTRPPWAPKPEPFMVLEVDAVRVPGFNLLEVE